MFALANVVELARIAQSVISQDVVSGSKVWRLNEQSRYDLRLAMFGRAKPDCDMIDVSPQDQSDLLSEFTETVAGPIIELLPPHTAALAALMLYEEFVKAVFIQPLTEEEVGGEG